MLRRRPIARTVARTAVVAGTATVVAGGVRRHQDNKYAAQAQAAEPQQPEVVYAEAPAPAPAARHVAGRDPTAQGPGRAQGAGDPHRGRVRGAEGQDPQRLSAPIPRDDPTVVDHRRARRVIHDGRGHGLGRHDDEVGDRADGEAGPVVVDDVRRRPRCCRRTLISRHATRGRRSPRSSRPRGGPLDTPVGTRVRACRRCRTATSSRGCRPGPDRRARRRPATPRGGAARGCRARRSSPRCRCQREVRSTPPVARHRRTRARTRG